MNGVFFILLGGCTLFGNGESSEIDEPIPEDIPYTDANRTGDCAQLAANWRGRHGSEIGCWDLASLDLFAADRLATLWIYEASAICAYDTLTAEVQGFQSMCGPMTGPGAFACPVDGSIAYDRPFFADQYVRHGDFAVVVILAHEWGHINQGVTGISYDPALPAITKELHADCQAGIFAAVEADVGLMDPGDVEEAFASLCEAGDPAGTPWFSQAAHGSCQERIDAFTWGFQQATARLSDVCGENPLRTMREICG